jgi:hypothetical protein
MGGVGGLEDDGGRSSEGNGHGQYPGEHRGGAEVLLQFTDHKFIQELRVMHDDAS